MGGAHPTWLVNPVALRYKERWRPTALSTRFTVSRHTHQQTQSNLVRGATSNGKLHCRLHRRLYATTALRLTSTPSPRHHRPGPHHFRHGYVELFFQARGWSVTSHYPSSLSLDYVLESFIPYVRLYLLNPCAGDPLCLSDPSVVLLEFGLGFLPTDVTNPNVLFHQMEASYGLTAMQPIGWRL